jgi:outer membrane protein TolC
MTFTEIDPGAWLKGLWRVAPSFVAAASLTGCATSPRPDAAQASLSNPVAAQWHAPLPHGGTLADLSRWWASFDDAPLLHLIQAAQQASDTLARADARIADARAARVESRAALLPALDAGLNANRGAPSLALPVSTTASLGVQASWEADLFGANRARAEMAQARWRASEGAWHVARVSLAAEVAVAYIGLRACEAQRAQAELDVRSRAETARLTALSAQAGFAAPAAADLARASAANARAALTHQRAQCDLFIKSLVALTAIEEGALRDELAASTGRLPRPERLRVAAVPAEALAQRPDRRGSLGCRCSERGCRAGARPALAPHHLVRQHRCPPRTPGGCQHRWHGVERRARCRDLAAVRRGRAPRQRCSRTGTP